MVKGCYFLLSQVDMVQSDSLQPILGSFINLV